MARFQYNGEGVRVFPSIGVTVKKGEQFNAPDNFKAVGVSLVTSQSVPKETKKSAPVKTVEDTPIEPSAPTDTTAGE